MTIVVPAGDRWEKEDGAPAGPSFNLHVPSSTDPDLVYNIIRDEPTGVVIHTPPCTAWSYGRRMCSHVKACIHRSEQPASVFLDVVGRLYDSTTWWAEGEIPPLAKRLITETKAALDEARVQITRNAAGAKARAASDAFRALPAAEQEAEAVAAWGERPGGRS